MTAVTQTIPGREKAKDWRSEAIVIALLATLVLVVRGAWFGDPNADIDEQLYSLIGLEMTKGALPFVDLWDRKPFGLFALFALAHAAGGPGPLSYQLLAALFVLAGAWMTYRLATALVDRVTGIGAGMLYILIISIYGSPSAQSEVFWIPMIMVMAMLVRDPDHPAALQRAYWAMFVGGLALQVKYTVLPQCLFFGLWVLWHQYRAGRRLPGLAGLAIRFALLGILPTLLVALAYGALGHWDEFVFANFISFFDRLPAPVGRFHRSHLIYLFPLLCFLVAGAYGAIRLAPPSDKRTYGFFVLWLVASVITIYFPSTVYLYYYGALAPVAVLVCLPILDRRGAAVPVALLLFVAIFGYLQYLPQKYLFAKDHMVRMDRLAAAIAPRVDDKNSCLYVFDGPTALYPMSGSCLPTRFIYPDHLNNELERYSLGVSQVSEIRRILSNRPPVIVTADTPFTPQNEEAKALVMTEVRKNYRDIAQEKLHERTIRVWERRQDAAR